MLSPQRVRFIISLFIDTENEGVISIWSHSSLKSAAGLGSQAYQALKM